MPSPSKIAILAGSTSEFSRWKAATLTGDDAFRVIGYDHLAGMIFVAAFCLPNWRTGYSDPDAILEMVRTHVVGSIPVAPTTGYGGIVASTVLAASVAAPVPLAAIDNRTVDQVLRSRGIPQELVTAVPGDCIMALVDMTRWIDRHVGDGSVALTAYNDFLGFYVQLLASTFGSRTVMRHRTSLHFPEIPRATVNNELFLLFPQRLVDEELRLFFGSSTVHFLPIESRRFVFRLYELRWHESLGGERAMLEAMRARLHQDAERLREQTEPPPRQFWAIDLARQPNWQQVPRSIAADDSRRIFSRVEQREAELNELLRRRNPRRAD